MTVRPMTEKDLQEAVEELLRLCRWRYIHIREMRGSNSGFPDLLAVKGRKALAIELKVGDNPPTAIQAEWLADLARVPGIESYVFTDRDWREGAVERVLTAREGVIAE